MMSQSYDGFTKTWAMGHNDDTSQELSSNGKVHVVHQPNRKHFCGTSLLNEVTEDIAFCLQVSTWV